MARKIYMTNFKGGAGVTSCCAGLGFALAEAGERTLVFDGDSRCASGMETGGVANMQTYTLADYEAGTCRAKQTIVSHPRCGNLSFCCSLNMKDENAAKRAADELDGLFDYILFDKICLDRCDGAIVVTEPFVASLKCSDACKAFLTDNGIKDVGLIVNKLNGGQIINGEVMTAQEISTLLRIPLTAVIPEDLSMPLGKWKKSTFKAFKIAADNITGKRQAVLNVLNPYFGIGGFIKRKARARM